MALASLTKIAEEPLSASSNARLPEARELLGAARTGHEYDSLRRLGAGRLTGANEFWGRPPATGLARGRELFDMTVPSNVTRALARSAPWTVGPAVGMELAKTRPFQEAGRALEAPLRPVLTPITNAGLAAASGMGRAAQGAQNLASAASSYLPEAVTNVMETAQPGIRKGLTDVMSAPGNALDWVGGKVRSGLGAIPGAAPAWNSFKNWSPSATLNSMTGSAPGGGPLPR